MEKNEALRSPEDLPHGRFLVRLRYIIGLMVYQRHDTNLPGHNNNIRFLERLHSFEFPSHVSSHNVPITTDFWDASENPDAFER